MSQSAQGPAPEDEEGVFAEGDATQNLFFPGMGAVELREHRRAIVQNEEVREAGMDR
jgi:hypothetical protein